MGGIGELLSDTWNTVLRVAESAAPAIPGAVQAALGPKARGRGMRLAPGNETGGSVWDWITGGQGYPGSMAEGAVSYMPGLQQGDLWRTSASSRSYPMRTVPQPHPVTGELHYWIYAGKPKTFTSAAFKKRRRCVPTCRPRRRFR